jgi:hypothetical protein
MRSDLANTAEKAEGIRRAVSPFLSIPPESLFSASAATVFDLSPPVNSADE